MMFTESKIARQAAATATVMDTWAGPIGAYLIPQQTRRNGERVTVYRWLDERGFLCDGLRHGFSAERMVAMAEHHPRFSNIATKSEG